MKRIPLSNVLTAVADEMIKAHINAEERGYAIMKFAECEFEFSVESEEQQGGKVTLWALEVTGGGKQTESNKVRIKYTNTEIPVAAAVAIELPEPDTNEGESSTP